MFCQGLINLERIRRNYKSSSPECRAICYSNFPKKDSDGTLIRVSIRNLTTEKKIFFTNNSKSLMPKQQRNQYNKFRKAMLGCRSAILLSRSMYNSLFERYLDVDKCSIGAFLILHFLLYQIHVKVVGSARYAFI